MDKIQQILDRICGDNYTEEWKNLNYKLIPTTVITATLGSEIPFNHLYQVLLNSGYEEIKRTKSGGISIKKECRLYHHHLFDVKQYNSVIEITVCKPVDSKMRSYRIQYRNNNYHDNNNNEKLVSGRTAYFIFRKELAKDGINLDDYAVSKEEGKKINNDIYRPDIRLMNFWWEGRTFENACHLDFHKFYMSGLMISHPEMAKTIKRLAEKSKEDSKYKTILAATIGYFHSPCCGYKYAQLARDAINTAYERFNKVFKQLEKDRMIIATNTDGIWYQGDEWHGEYESTELGGWSNDHVNCKIRFKSAGSYEYIEGNKYTPVVRGRTRLDEYKDRKYWRWGDIFKFSANIEVYKFEKGVGIVWQKIM